MEPLRALRRAMALRTLLAIGATSAAIAAGVAPEVSPQGPSPSRPYVPWIERRAATAFDRTAALSTERHGLFTIDAHVLLPLGFASPEIWSRSNVGTASFTHRELPQSAEGDLQTWELLAGSIPERARGYNRQGFFREAVLIEHGASAWTAYFGAMTTWNEKTLSEAKASSDGASPGTVDAIDGLTSPLQAHATVFRVKPDRAETDPAELWKVLLSKLGDRPPRYQRDVNGSAASPLPTLAFIGALETSLASAARHRDHPQRPVDTRVNFMHNEVARTLELSSMKAAPDRARPFAGTNLVQRPQDVFELHYRVLTPGQDEGAFKLWVELPPIAAGDPAPAIIPLVVDVKMKAYLELEFRRSQ